MNFRKILLVSLLLSPFSYAKNYLDENLQSYKWNGIDIVWMHDDTLPTYDVTFYFQEGALGDKPKLFGMTDLMFNQLTSGTKRYSQKQIVESLEFYGASYRSKVTHEFSLFNVGGLVKDFVPTMKMICHLFDNADFPKRELNQTKSRGLSRLKNLVTDHSKIASRAFRYESLKGTGFENPTEGTIKSLKNISSRDLKKRLEFFNKQAVKRVYIKGPKEVKELKGILANDCKWKQGHIATAVPVVKSLPEHKKIIFVSLPNANQVQLRIGRVLKTDEVNIGTEELKTFAANHLGGGFTSQLMQVLRVQKGLTYSAGAVVAEQGNYGRALIATFTKNKTLLELLESTLATIKKNSQKIDQKSFVLSRNNLKGNYLLGLESTTDFLQNLIIFDHRGKDYEEIYKFSKKIDSYKKSDLEKMIKELFGRQKQTILVAGDKKLVQVLKKAGFEVDVKDYKQYL